MITNCFWLLKKLLDFTSGNVKDPALFSDSVRQLEHLYVDDEKLPSRRTDVNFSAYSAVIGKDLICRSDSRFEIQGSKGYNIQVRGRNRRLPGAHADHLGRRSNSSSDSFFLKVSNMKHHKKSDEVSCLSIAFGKLDRNGGSGGKHQATFDKLTCDPL